MSPDVANIVWQSSVILIKLIIIFCSFYGASKEKKAKQSKEN